MDSSPSALNNGYLHSLAYRNLFIALRLLPPQERLIIGKRATAGVTLSSLKSFLACQ
ncbi:MAG: hypothetical protein N2319_07330 [Candidatus Kapabacteria bacterium]|nr:hypothetical protein [Candidatus Kapabacteria bacterium]